ncbi:MAG: Bro-N domain-containing protein [Firmicutes bacterium]|nr:Bro-N domain-containing protein [Bacillota bacterium]
MSNIKLFEDKQVRAVWSEAEQKWYFSVVDVCGVLTEQPTQRGASNYWAKLKQRLEVEGSELLTNCQQLKMLAPDGKMRATDALNVKGIFRLIQSIPSPKAEPFKMWLAQVGSERLEEIENPEIANARIKEIYRQKGYSDAWIEKRIRGIQVRDELTDEWKKRGVKEEREYAILTAEISKATFGMTPSEYRVFKGMAKSKENLRDHMDDLELIFTMLGEVSTRRIAESSDAKGFWENKSAAQKGGSIAGDARRQLEIETGQRVSSKENYLTRPESEKRKVLSTNRVEMINKSD